MTAVTVPARSGRLHGLTWAMFRLHRSALWFWVMLVAVAAGALLWAYGPGVTAAEEVYRKLGCGQGLCGTSDTAFQRYELAATVGSGLLTVAPVLIAAWAGGSLIGRELEQGTARLAWTQSVTPVRWLAAKLAVPAALITAGTLLLTLLHRLLWSADGTLRAATGTRDWYDSVAFTANGTLATAYALLALAVGALAGLLTRRTTAGLGVGVLGLLTLTVAVSELRPRLWPTETVTGTTGYPAIGGAFVDEGALTSTGARVQDPLCIDDAQCLADHDIVGFYRDYHPSSHFWPLQLVETGIVLAVTALAVLAAFQLLRRRTT
ncbi:transporter [Streptomyces spinoverrucosus]|uniref:Transporter n=1 Tax=Streptomyces spinoverrucosus TaxID=284043 RepID=A0A4Y3VQH1_9ACTN|nr:ABC transporter permease [Streptomyces spinoverrucosus]GEC09262.1 transporter [Streptomyces spinoverrucosus]GHB52503.1 transporter [Streptomyces spinoverrucosus]